MRDIVYVFQGIDGKHVKMDSTENRYKVEAKVQFRREGRVSVRPAGSCQLLGVTGAQGTGSTAGSTGQAHGQVAAFASPRAVLRCPCLGPSSAALAPSPCIAAFSSSCSRCSPATSRPLCSVTMGSRHRGAGTARHPCCRCTVLDKGPPLACLPFQNLLPHGPFLLMPWSYASAGCPGTSRCQRAPAVLGSGPGGGGLYRPFLAGPAALVPRLSSFLSRVCWLPAGAVFWSLKFGY